MTGQRGFAGARGDSRMTRAGRAVGVLAAGALLALGSPLATSAAGGPGVIAGTVYDSGGNPTQGVRVSACALECTQATTAVDGRFTLTGLDAGAYRVAVLDYAGRLPGGYASATGLTADPAVATVVSVGTAPVTLDIHAPVAVAIRGTVTGSAGTPASGIMAFACTVGPSGTAAADAVCGVARSGADGSYAVPVLAARYEVYYLDPSGLEASAYFSTAGPTLSEAKASSIVVGGADVTGIDIHLVAGQAVAGTVSDANGQPLAGIRAMACLKTQLDACSAATTTATGSYSILGLPAGAYYVAFLDPALAHAAGFFGSAGFTADSTTAAIVSLGATGATGVDVRLPVGQLVSGKVLDAAGRPAHVWVADCTGTLCMPLATTAADGTFAMRLASGKSVIRADDETGANLSGYYSTAGLANWLHATIVTVGSTDITGITIQLRRVTASIHAGTSHSGSFTSSIAVTRNTYATVRVFLGKGFAGTRVQVMRATRSSSGIWSAYRSVATVVVTSNGYAYYSAKISGTLRFRASVSDTVLPGVYVVSSPVYARSR